MVTDKQVQLLRLKLAENKTIECAAAAADMSARSAHTWKTGPLPSQTKTPRHWRTRQDVFADVWDTDIVPLLERDTQGVLEATTIIAELRRVHESRFDGRHLRTPQRQLTIIKHPEGPPPRKRENRDAPTKRMRWRFDTPLGREIDSRRMGTVEPVFANIQNKGMRRFTLRGQKKVSAQWKLFTMVHNIEKVAGVAMR